MKIIDHKETDSTGGERIIIEIEQARIVPVDCSTPEFWTSGGMYVRFAINHKRKETEAVWMFLYRGSPQIGGKIRTWRDEAWTEEECLRFCKENYGGKR